MPKKNPVIEEDDADQTRAAGLDADGEGKQKPPVPASDPTRIVLGVFLGVAALMFLIFGISGFLAAQRMGREQRAQGTVVELIEQEDSEGDMLYYPVVAYNLPGYGILTVRLPEGSWPPAYEVGEVVTVRYDPLDPREARVQSVMGLLGLWILPLISGVLGAAFLGAVLLVRWIGDR
jgi:hypothetical protein